MLTKVSQSNNKIDKDSEEVSVTWAGDRVHVVRLCVHSDCCWFSFPVLPGIIARCINGRIVWTCTRVQNTLKHIGVLVHVTCVFVSDRKSCSKDVTEADDKLAECDQFSLLQGSEIGS